MNAFGSSIYFASFVVLPSAETILECNKIEPVFGIFVKLIIEKIVAASQFTENCIYPVSRAIPFIVSPTARILYCSSLAKPGKVNDKSVVSYLLINVVNSVLDSFDNKSEAKINPKYNENAYKLDVCILTFSNVIEEYVLKKYKCEKIGEIKDAADTRFIYKIDYKGKKIGFFKTYVGAPSCVGSIETSVSQIKVDKFILFGGAGCLNKEIAHGKVMVPTEAYRDEGTSYHYAEPSDYITISNCSVVSSFMKTNEIPYIEGKTWTTDAFYRETRDKINYFKSKGAVCVEMEGTAIAHACYLNDTPFVIIRCMSDMADEVIDVTYKFKDDKLYIRLVTSTLNVTISVSLVLMSVIDISAFSIFCNWLNFKSKLSKLTLKSIFSPGTKSP